MASSINYQRPPEPCKGCKHEGCIHSALINRLAVDAWLSGQSVGGCEDYARQTFRGLEGCYV